MYALVDANSFYASCERVFRPEWRNKPIAVVSNNDGCIVALNRAANAAGIEKFKPYFEVRRACEKAGVIVCSSNYELYGNLSVKMMDVIGRFAPEQYIYSIDESFLSFKDTSAAIPDLRVQGAKIRCAVWKECRLPVCVGIGPKLALAKIVNHAAKKVPGYQGVCVLDTEGEREAVLAQLDVGDVWGIGRRISAKLKLLGVHTALDLARMPPKHARKQFSIEIERTVLDLNGVPAKHWDEAKADKKQIYSTRSMGERITDLESLQQALAKHAAIAARKARAQGSVCKTLLCFASSSPFDDQPFSRKALHQFPVATTETTVLSEVVTRLDKELFRPGVRYYKVGVGLIEMMSGAHAQGDLFNPDPSNPKLMQALDGLNGKYGTDTLFVAAQSINPQWGMKRQMLTPQYTTRWRDIPRVRCG